MPFHQPGAELFFPQAHVFPQVHGGKGNLGQTTHLGVGAHQDDLEILAAHGILECFDRPGKAFTGAVVSDGGGCPRSGPYSRLSDEEMKALRRQEQKAAACLGRYQACLLLDYPSAEVKSPFRSELVEDLYWILKESRPQVVYTHNLFDKHDTHVAVGCALLDALRRLSPSELPEQVIGCEVWRDLDWLPDERKIVMDVSENQELQEQLLAVFKSQIAGGKRYDLATMGRRRAHATFSESHREDRSSALIYGMDLMPLVLDGELNVDSYLRSLSQKFVDDVAARLARLMTTPSD